MLAKLYEKVNLRILIITDNIMKTVGIIGAGPAGLCAAKHVLEHKDKLKLIIWEKSNELGGTWNYTTDIGLDQYGLPIHSSMYQNLRY